MSEIESTPENMEVVKERGRFFLPGPSITLLTFAQALTGTILTDLIVYRTCLVTLNINETNCSVLHTNASSPEARSLEAKVEPYASTIVMTNSLIQSVLPAVLSLFFGPWSDRGGRRPLFLAAFTGSTLMYAILALMCNWSISPWYLSIPLIPAHIMGGHCAVLLASVCYITDTTGEKDRTMLLAWLQAFSFGGVLLGIFAGPLIYKHYGYAIVFTTAAICCKLALIYTYFCVPETVKDASKESICGLFKFSVVKELFASSLVARDGFHRSIVWIAISVLTFGIMTLDGEFSIGFLFTRARLGWNVQQYSYLNGANVLIHIAGVLCGVSLFDRVLGLPDTVLVCVALLCSVGAAMTKSLTTQSWHMYLSACIGLCSGLVGPAIRSIISKSVPAQDVGKVFSLMTSLETLSALGGAPLFTQIYSHYLPPIYPSPVYLVSSGIYVLLIILVVCIEVLIRKSRSSNYATLVHNDQTNVIAADFY